MDRLERFLAGLAVLMSAATLGAAYMFRFDFGYSAFDRFSWSLGYAFGPWVVAAAMSVLILVGGNLLKFRIALAEIFFTVAAGASAVAILEAFR